MRWAPPRHAGGQIGAAPPGWPTSPVILPSAVCALTGAGPPLSAAARGGGGGGGGGGSRIGGAGGDTHLSARGSGGDGHGSMFSGLISYERVPAGGLWVRQGTVGIADPALLAGGRSRSIVLRHQVELGRAGGRHSVR